MKTVAKPTDALMPKRAVIYARVSTKKQASGSAYDPEGFSLPAQRDACERKAEQLGAVVVDVYVDKGESAKTAQRPNFQKMLQRIQAQRDVDYVICDKLDRFARNRRDDANLLFDLKMAGATLVSVKENIDDTPAGQLLHAIMAGLAEFYSRNLATEAVKGMTQKAKTGGTPGKAPIGYINTRRKIAGREVRTVTVDPVRASLVKWAFEAYATGEWTLRQLTEALEIKRLRAEDRYNAPAKPMHLSRVAHMLNNRYYIGYVSFQGVEYQGHHQPLIPQALFERVQEVLRSRKDSGEKLRRHAHYLKGSVFCAFCGSRLCFTRAKGHGGEYDYLFCLGRHQKREDCKFKYTPVTVIEDAVAEYYEVMRIPEVVHQVIVRGLVADLEYQQRQAAPEIRYAKKRVEELETERKRLARGVIDGSIPGDLARDEHDRIDREREEAARILDAAEKIAWSIDTQLTQAIDLAARCHEVYRKGSGAVRRMCNQYFFEKILIGDDGKVVGVIYREPWGSIFAGEILKLAERKAANRRTRSSSRLGLKMTSLVAPTGLEPTDRPGFSAEKLPEVRASSALWLARSAEQRTPSTPHAQRRRSRFMCRTSR